ncbi:helix-turn-helix transcriptional regulator [Actinokineospora sp. NBRC 105648]|uniref:helix-turn-helix domain-containing protein n=1 Tax=Actinokineospora sp. NBRC 105648 TaxID=3032206 RepID=UPI002556B9C8|nr:helix-turn-helix transcriptional regulator [Actinokineospora sp. NBRC 105648]
MAGVTGDWAKVSEEIKKYMRDREMNQADLIHSSGISKMIVSELQNNSRERSRADHILRSISEALGLHRDHLRDIANGNTPRPPSANPQSPDEDYSAHRLDAIESRLDEILSEVKSMGKSLATDLSEVKSKIDVNHPTPPTK